MKLKNVSIKLGLPAILVAASVSLVTPAHAQLGGIKLPSLGGGQASEPAVDVGSLLSQQKGLVGRFNSAMNNMLLAQARTLAALNLNEESEKAAAAAESYASGNVVAEDQIKRDVELSKASLEQINAAKAKGEQLTSDGKQSLMAAIPHYVKGMADGVKLPKEFEKWSSVAQGGFGSLASNPMDALKLKDGIGEALPVITNLPGLIKVWSETTTTFVQYAKGNDLDVSEIEKVEL